MQETMINREIEYDNLISRVNSLLLTSNDLVSNMANIASVLYWSLDSINWMGFYLKKGGSLVLGPFHGKHACATIPIGKGVCGSAALHRKTLIVADVREFHGHIACDTSTLSELVVPLVSKGKLIGVLDVDSQLLDRFTASEQYLFEDIAHRLMYSMGESDPKRAVRD